MINPHKSQDLTPVRWDFACVRVTTSCTGTLREEYLVPLSPPVVDIGTSNVHKLFQKLRHPKRKEKRGENNSRLVVFSWVSEISP